MEASAAGQGGRGLQAGDRPGSQEIYLKAYASLDEARTGVGLYFRFFNGERPHTSHNNCTPLEVYRGEEVLRRAA